MKQISDKTRVWLIAACLLLPALCLLLPPAANAQSAGVLAFEYTYNLFAHSDTATLVEVAYGFSDKGIRYQPAPADGKNEGRLQVHLLFQEQGGGRKVYEDTWVVKTAKSADGKPQWLVGIRNMILRPGKYRSVIGYSDPADPGRRDSTLFELTVPSFAGKALMASDLEIASEMESSEETNDPLYKNTYRVVPNTSGEIGPANPTLFTYAEIYNFNTIPAEEFSVLYLLADSARKVIYEREYKRPRPRSSAVLEVRQVPLDMLPSGQYYLVMKLFNGPLRSANDSLKVVRSFVLLNPERDSVLTAGQKHDTAHPLRNGAVTEPDPLYAGMSEKELDEEYQKVKFIATTAEKKLWEGMSDIPAKIRYLTQFWARRDPQDRIDYQKRVQMARVQYSSAQRPNGWDSDRGRVLLQYGKPDDIDRHPHDVNRKPYEIWRYTTKGYMFVFVDRPQSGNYTLVHSDVPGEVQFENWETDYATLVRDRTLPK